MTIRQASLFIYLPQIFEPLNDPLPVHYDMQYDKYENIENKNYNKMKKYINK